jgi:hypothetical protein
MQDLRIKVDSFTKETDIKFNTQLFDNKKNTYNFVLPNNGNKYYLYVTSVSHSNPTYGNPGVILYFFGKSDEFCLEINSNGVNNKLLGCLFEGYIYEEDRKYTYQVSDILYKNEKHLEKLSFSKRQMILSDILYSPIVQSIIYKDLNTTFTIDIACVFYKNDNLDTLIKFNKFYRYFVYYDYINDNGSKYRDILEKDDRKEHLVIKKGEKTEIYNVYNPKNMDFLGILYVPSLSVSKYLKNTFAGNCTGGFAGNCTGGFAEGFAGSCTGGFAGNCTGGFGSTPKESITHLCTFNYNFNKWELVI